MSILPHKCCTKCGTDKPLSEFPYEPRADRYRANCKVCERVRQRAWYNQNKDYFKQRAATHRDEMLAATRKYNAANRKKRNIASRVRYARNPERARQYARDWGKRNPERRAANYNRYRTQRIGNGGSYTPEEWQALCVKYDQRCLACQRRRRLTADHIVPVSKGGSSDISNIQPLCHSCNASKRDKIIDYRPRYESGFEQQEMLI